MNKNTLISIIIPVYNEAANLPLLHQALANATKPLPYQFELLFIDDGSTDDSAVQIKKLAAADKQIELIELSKNFGKEAATTAGLHKARGNAAIMIDADLQHPPELIKDFLAKWESGAEVVVGIRRGKGHTSWLKNMAGKMFYRILNSIAETKVIPSATDYRLLDRVVIDEFNRFTEHNRMTRGLIDWLGFKREYIYFQANKRRNGQAAYSFRKLFGLAAQSFVALSLFPLKAAGYLGVIITLFSGPMGILIFVEKYILQDPWSLDISGTAILAIMIVFLVGIILMALGLMALYIAHIYSEVANRPLYVIRPPRTDSIKLSSKEQGKGYRG